MIDPDNLRKCAADKSVCGAGRHPCVFEDELRSAADEIEQCHKALALAWDVLRWAASPAEAEEGQEWSEVPYPQSNQALEQIIYALRGKNPAGLLPTKDADT